MKNVQIINGPNLNLLGKREKHLYGYESFESVLSQLRRKYPKVTIEHVQTNIEGHIVDEIHKADKWADAIVLNPGGFTHTSIAIRDAVLAVDIPVTEVHISNIASREGFRHNSVISGACDGCITGFGINGYFLAIENLLLLDIP
ncbi:MAG: type II 3-dehydroquinate dehydratase [Bacteroidales bacterium]